MEYRFVSGRQWPIGMRVSQALMEKMTMVHGSRFPLPDFDRLRSTKNFIGIMGLVSAYATQAARGRLFIRDHKARVDFFTQNVSTYTRRALECFNFDIQVFGYQTDLMREKRFLLVGNHLSYLDIFVLSSIQPCVFVTSVDMHETPFLGQMAELGGSLFVERRNRSHIGRDIGVMADTLRDGHHVVVYPEGTSGNGGEVMRFKRTLLTSAIDASADLMPVVVKYTEIDGKPFSVENRDRVCWYGDMTFTPHFLGLLSLKKVKVELHFAQPITVTATSDRRVLAEECHKVISEIYGKPFQA